MIRILIHGCNGKMGQVIAAAAAADPECIAAAGADKFPKVLENPFPVYGSLAEVQEAVDVVIDFSVPQALPALLEFGERTRTPLVIATTGLSREDLDLIEQRSADIPIFRAANMSIGVNLMYELTQRAATVLGDSFDIEIVEKHHNQKIDAPSGTAYALADAINEIFLNSKHYVFGRHSKNDKRTTNEIGVHALRGGTIAGEHSVLYAGKDEILEITHSAHSKMIFAQGALTAAKFIQNRTPGLYNMKDVMLEESSVTNIYTSSREAMITIHQVPNEPPIIAGIFGKLAKDNINVDMISQTAPSNGLVNISFTLPESSLSKAVHAIGEYNNACSTMRTDVFAEITKLTVEGLGMERQSGVAARVFEVMAAQDIRIKIITTSETKIACVIDQEDEKRAVEAIIEAFDL